jgi:hypothetical protein
MHRNWSACVRCSTDLLKTEEGVDVNIFAKLGELAIQSSKAEHATYQSHDTGGMLKDNLIRILQVGMTSFAIYCSYLALEAGSSDAATCAAANTTALEPADAAVIAEDWDSLQSAVYIWGLINLIGSISMVASALCVLQPASPPSECALHYAWLAHTRQLTPA